MLNKIPYLLLLVALLSACGPVTAHSNIAKAQIAVDAAQGAQADVFAVYEYESAVQYLLKAKEEEGYSSFQKANDLAQKATDFADQARARALSRNQGKNK